MDNLEVNVKNWKSLIKPAKLDVKLSDDKTIAKITAEPLEKGYGLTLGNSLRRVLLSSIRGAAVTSIQIDGVLHEFTSIKGVREDVTDIVLNVKNLAIKSSSSSSKVNSVLKICLYSYLFSLRYFECLSKLLTPNLNSSKLTVPAINGVPLSLLFAIRISLPLISWIIVFAKYFVT